MLSGRRLIHQVCRVPMAQIGWRPRASGWFTLPVSDGCLGVVAVGTASEHSARGEADATAYVGLRDDAVERIICQLCEIKDDGYQQRTVVLPIGYLMPGRSWLEWHVTPGSAAQVAAELAEAVSSYAVPYLCELAGDPGMRLEEARRAAGLIAAPVQCRVAVLMARAGQLDEALAFAAACRETASGEDAAWGVAQRSWADAFGRWAARDDGPGP